MPTPTSRLGLLKPSTSDAFSTSDIAANWQKIDDNPGVFICTSSSRPAWGTQHAGREIIEVDTMLKWIWTGSTGAGGFIRTAPSGLLKTTSGGWAQAQRTSLFQNSAASYKVVTAVTNVVVPAGNRSLMLIATWTLVNNPNGRSALGLFNTASDNTGFICSWQVSGDSASAVQGATGGGASYVHILSGGAAAGTYNFSLQLYSYAGVSSIDGLAEISVTEI